jgi:hypothetical protein
MQDKMMAARAARLGTIQEIIETCADAGGKIDIDFVTEVLQEALETVDAGAPDSVLRSLNDEERLAVCGLSTLQSALRNLTWYMAQTMKRGRVRSHLEKLPEQFSKLVNEALLTRMEMMPKTQVAEVLAEASRWAFVIWTPSEQVAVFDMLATIGAGKYVKKEQQERARGLLDRYSKSMPLGGKYANGNIG